MNTKQKTASTKQVGALNTSATLHISTFNQAETARAIDTLSRRLARQVARRAECFGGHAPCSDAVAELESIHRSNLARAWRVSGVIPEVGELFASKDYMRGAGRLAWTRAIGRAQVESNAELYSRRRSFNRNVPIVEDYGDNSRSELVRGRINRRTVKHARECLVAFWTLGKSRKYRSALHDDLRTLAMLARVARGAGFGLLGEVVEDFNSSAVRKSIQRLISRIGQGDILLTDSSELAEQSLTQWRAERVLSRS